MPRHCLICSSPDKMRTAQEMVAAGATDQAVGDRVGASRAAAERHRKNHLRPVVQALAQGAQKDAPARQQRQEIVAAAAKGELDPAMFLSMGSLTAELRKAADRIERASSEAEKAGSLTALAQLLGQAHKNVETRAKLSGIGNFGTKVAVGIGIGGGPAFTPFTVRINHSDGHSQTFVMAREGAPDFRVLDATTQQPFAESNGAAIVTRGEESTHDLMIVPTSYPTNAPVIDHEPSGIEQPAAPVPDDAEQDIDSLLSSVFDAKADEPEGEVEPAPAPAPAPRRGRSRLS